MSLLPVLMSLPAQGWIVFQQRNPLTFDEPVGDLPVVGDARWSAAFTGNSWGAFLTWVLLLVVLQAVGWPIVRRVFTVFPDGGWAFSRPMTVLLAGYFTWLLASIHAIRFQAIWAALALGVVAASALLLSKRLGKQGADVPSFQNRILLTSEAIFWGVFALFLLFRLINPDSYHPYWGGEKAMEFAHLNAILRSAHFPPVDPWYSGGFINYYYYGTYLVAFLIKLTGIPVEYAFNLAQPTFPALLASASFSLGAALGKRMTGSGSGAWVAGTLSAIFVQFSGNMVVAARLVTQAIRDEGPFDGWGHWVWSPSRALPTPDRGINITEFPYFGALYADLHPHVIAMPFTILLLALAWQMAASWRMLPLLKRRPRASGTDLTSTAAPALLASLTLGSLFMINAWDLPMYAIIIGVAVIMMTAGLRDIPRRAGVIAVVIATIGVLGYLVALPFNLHYVALFGEIDTVRDRTPLLGIEAHLGAPLLLVTVGGAALVWTRSGWSRAMQVTVATTLALLLTFFLLLQWLAIENHSASAGIAEAGVVATVAATWLVTAWNAVTTHGTLPRGVTAALQAGVVAVAATVAILLVVDRMTLGLYAGTGLSAGTLWLALPRPSERFVMLLVASATLLGGSLELLYLVDDLSGGDWYRMNTIFKFYNQIWNLLGIAAGVLAGRAVWDILAHGSDPVGGAPPGPSRVWTWVTAAMVVPLIFATLAYAVVATPIRLETRFPGGHGLTLDAYGWMDYAQIQLFRVDQNGQRVQATPLAYRDDLAIINWLNDNVHGTPVIAEAAFGTYRCNGSRFSIATGLPAVIGWQRHEQQQRYLDDLAAREGALRELYTTPDSERQLEIIDEYGIEFIMVGQTERHYPSIEGNDCIDTGSPEAIASLESLVGTRLEPVFTSGDSVVYRVLGG